MPYKEEETETVLPFRGGFRRGSWNARRALLRPLYCLLVGDNISVLLSARGTEPMALPGTRASASPFWGVGTNCKAPLFYRPIHIRVGW